MIRTLAILEINSWILGNDITQIVGIFKVTHFHRNSVYPNVFVWTQKLKMLRQIFLKSFGHERTCSKLKKNKIKQPEGLKYLMKTGLGNFFTWSMIWC